MKKAMKQIIQRAFPKLYTRLGEIKVKIVMKNFKKDYPLTKIFSPTEREFYSQDNQDYIIYEHFFKNKKDGFFCDIGGNHPLNINNTRFFEELGWRGIAFEPLPHMKKLWKEHRSAKLFSFALSDKEGKVNFTIVKDTTGWEDMLSFVKETRDIDYGYETEELEVETKIFKNIMKEESIKHIDFLSLDVEGHELNVLKGIDFKEVQIDVLTIENNPPSSVIYGDREIRNLMFDNDYLLWGRIVGLDDIYVHKKFLETEDS